MSGVFRIGLKIVGAVLTKHVKVIIEMSRVLHPLHWKDIINTSVLIANHTRVGCWPKGWLHINFLYKR